MSLRWCAAAILGMTSVVVAPGRAQVDSARQRPDTAPARPRIDWPAADTNDAETYMRWARNAPRQAWAAAWWAVRLEPANPEARQLLWFAWIYDHQALMRDLVQEKREAIAEFAAQRYDTIYARAMLIDPFVDGSRDPGALAYHGSFLTAHPRSIIAHIAFAADLYAQGSNARSIDVLRDAMNVIRAREADSIHLAYQSLEMFEYAIGRAYLADGNLYEARHAFSRALEENLGFYMAHAAMGEAAMASVDTATATREYGEAVALNPTDAALRFAFGTALAQAQRYDEAAEQFRQAIALDPDFASPYFDLASALEHMGHAAEAVAAFDQFLARAPRRMQKQMARAREQRAALADLLHAAKGPDNR